jgi:hypothetical protein
MPSQIAAEIDGGLDFTADGAEFAGSNIVRLNDGQLNGQVASVESSRQSVGGTEVFIIRNNREMARTTADRSGRFTVRGLEPGVYDFIAAGSNGIAAVRFQATDGESVLDQNNQDNSIVPVSFRKPVAVASAAALQVCLTCGEDAGVVNEQINYSAENAVVVDSVPYDATPIEYASESVGCGCAVGGSCGSCGSFSGAGVAGMGAVGGGYGGIGGGFGGGGFVGGGRLLGGGGFGRLISLGGLAGGIVALADDEGTVVIPASPSNASN